MNDTINALRDEALTLSHEHREYRHAKERKDKAEDVLLGDIVDAVRPVLPAISSRVDGLPGPLRRAVALDTRGLYLGEQGDFFRHAGQGVVVYTIDQVLNETTLTSIAAILLTAVRAQSGKYGERTKQINREASILEGIAQAFKIGGVR